MQKIVMASSVLFFGLLTGCLDDQRLLDIGEDVLHAVVHPDTTPSPVPPPPSEPGIVAYYPFDGNADDISGNGHHATVYGPVLAPDRFGRANSAYYFNGGSDYIGVDSFPILSGNFAISAWCKGSGGASLQTLLAFGTAPNCMWNVEYDYGYHYYGWNSWDNGNGSWLDHSLGFLMNIPAWTHVVMQYQDSVQSIYVNGALLGSRKVSTPIPYNGSQYLNFGRDWVGMHDHENWHGYMDEVRIFSRPLTLDEIRGLAGLGDRERMLD